MIENLLKELGFTDDDINRILSTKAIQNIKTDNLIYKIQINNAFLTLNGYTQDDVVRMIRKFPTLFAYNIERRFSRLLDLGYTQDELIKMTKRLPQLYSYNHDTILSKQESLIKTGYTMAQIHLMSKKFPEIYSFEYGNGKETNRIETKLEEINMMGYSRNDSISMTAKSPEIFSLDNATLRAKTELLIKLGYTPEEVKCITVGFPQIYGLSIETITDKINFYDSIGLHYVPVIKPTALMQNVKLVYARLKHLEELGLDINQSNLYLLFVGNKYYENKFHITKEEILNTYKYDEEEIYGRAI